MFYRATGENQRGCAPLGVGQTQAARPCRTVGDHGIVRVFRERKKLLTSGGKLLVLRKPRLERGCPQIVKGQVAAKIDDGGIVIDQLQPDRQRLAVLGLRVRRRARARQQVAEVVVAVRQSAAEFGDGGVLAASF